MSKKLHIFNDIWLKHFKWLSPSSDFHRAYCEVCSSSVFVGHSGIWAIIAHAKALKHLDNLAKNSNRKRAVRMPKLDIQVPIRKSKISKRSSSISSRIASSPTNIKLRSTSCQDLATQEEFNVASSVNSSVHPLKETVNMDNVNDKNELKDCLPAVNDDSNVREITPDTKNEKISQDHMQDGGKSREDNSSTEAINTRRTSNAELTTTAEVLPKDDLQDGSKRNNETLNYKKAENSITNCASDQDILVNENPLGGKCHEDAPYDFTLASCSSSVTEPTVPFKNQKSQKTDTFVRDVHKKYKSYVKSSDRDKLTSKKSSKSSFKVGDTIRKKKIKSAIGNSKLSKSQTNPEKIKQPNSLVQFSKEKSEKSVLCSEQTSGSQVEVPKFELGVPCDTAHSLSKSENFSLQQMSQRSQQKTQATETSSRKDALGMSLPATEPLCKRSETENPLNLPVQRPLKHKIRHKKRVNGKSNTFECPSSEPLSISVVDVNSAKMHQNSKEKHRKKIFQIEPTREHSTVVQDTSQRKSKQILKAGDNCSALANVSSVCKIPKQNEKSLCKPYENKVLKKTNTQKRREVNTSISKKHEGAQTSKKQELCSAKKDIALQNNLPSNITTPYKSGKDYYEHLSELDTCFFASTHSQKKATLIRNIFPKPSKNSLLKNVALQTNSRPNSSIGFDSTVSNSDERLGQSTCNYSETESADVQFIGSFPKSDISSCNYRSAILKTEVEGTSSQNLALRNACCIPPNIVNSTNFFPRVTNSPTSRAVKTERQGFSPGCSSECNSKTVACTHRCHVPRFPEESMSSRPVSNCLTPFNRKIFNIKDFRAGMSCFSNRLLERKRTFEAECGQILQELEMFLSQAITMKSSNASEFDFIDSIYDKYRRSPKRNTLDVIKLLLALCSDNPDSSKTHKFSEGESFSPDELNQFSGILNNVPDCSSKKECTDHSSSVNSHTSAETMAYENQVLRNRKRQHSEPTSNGISSKKKKD